MGSEADEITADVTDTIMFVDQGSNFERVLCPQCGVELSIEHWQKAMDRAQSTQFTDLAMAMHCCGATTSLNDLEYEWPAGSARFELTARNPNVMDLTGELHMQLEQILGTRLRRVWAHY